MHPNPEKKINRHGREEREELPLKRTRRNSQDNRKSRNDKRKRHKRRQRNTPPTSRELATDYPVLTLEVAVETNDEDEHGYADERRS